MRQDSRMKEQDRQAKQEQKRADRRARKEQARLRRAVAIYARHNPPTVNPDAV